MYAYAPPSAVPVEVTKGFRDNNGTLLPENMYAQWSAEELRAFHVYEIIEPTIPDGQRIVSTELQRKTGPVRVERVATLEDIPLADLKAVKKAQADALCDAKMSAGYDHDFGGAYGVKRLQTRESDRPYWLALAQVSAVMVMAGQGASSAGAIRAEDNVNVPVTAQQALDAMLAMQAHLGVILAALWPIKDTIIAATDAAEVAAVDLSPLE